MGDALKERKRNGILCLFALVCVAILLSASLMVLAGNGNDTNRNANSNGSDNGMHVDENGYLVVVYDESKEFVGEKERLGERIPSNKEFDACRLTFETHENNTVWVTDYDGAYRDIIVPDKVIHDDQEWTVTEIADWGLSTKSIFGRHPHTVEIGPSIETLGDHCLSDERDTPSSDNLTKFEIRDIDNSKLTTIGERAFYWTEITSIELPKTLRVIGEDAFFSCNVEVVTLHSETLDIRDNAFHFANVSQINLENVRHIGEQAFCDTNLTTLDLSSATEIGKRAFYCERISYVKFSPDLTSLDENAFIAFEDGEASYYYQFYDADHVLLWQCAEDLCGKTFEKMPALFRLIQTERT